LFEMVFDHLAVISGLFISSKIKLLLVPGHTCGNSVQVLPFTTYFVTQPQPLYQTSRSLLGHLYALLGYLFLLSG
jgi:hypothetical protein